jgi:predicted metalloprotease with PDZ domain
LLFAQTEAGAAGQPVSYEVDLRSPATHLVAVTMSVPDTKAGTQLHFPAWTALYQIRDLVRNVLDVQARCDGKTLDLMRADIHTWNTGGEACTSLELRYSVYLNESSVFSSGLDKDHAYLNLAMALFYLPAERGRAVRVRYSYPEKWKLATLLPGPDADGWYEAANYDELVDSPAEAGAFQEYRYEQSGAEYRIVVHADAKAYDSKRLVETVKRITAAGTALMQDVPFSRFTFIYHFAQDGGGGLEHRDGTAISVSTDTLKANWLWFESVTAHEFVHAWNVKRIRPQNLEPVDYIRGNDTSDLWLCEGVTSTLGEYILLRAGMNSKKTFYERFAAEINQLQHRPARKFQSVEVSGREAWLEKYPDYRRPERSISYYNKGEIVGFMLDLAIRHASSNTRSLDDFFHRLNEDFAKRGRFFTRENLVRVLYELAPDGCDFRQFFRDTVEETQELDYDTYLGYAGLRLERTSGVEPSLGFAAVQNFGGPVIVQSVESGGSAERAGIASGDELLEMMGKPLRSLPDLARSGLAAGSEVQFRVRREGRELAIRVRLDSAPGTSYSIEEDGKATDAQRRLRDYWLKGTTLSGAGEAKR